MVDVDRRTPGLTPAHVAGLRRLSARAAAGVSADRSTPGPARKSLLSFTSFADALVGRLRAGGVEVAPGLTTAEFARVEAELGFVFPPDLHAVLAAGLPVSPGFPDWRGTCLSPVVDVPIAAVSVQIAKNSLWLRSWGSKPVDPDRALLSGRSQLKKAPILIPLFNHCYIPATPSLAGNPVFYVDETQVLCCGFDLADFFERFGSKEKRRKPASFSASSSSLLTPSSSLSRRSLDSSGKPPRWVEFWSDAADHRRRRSSSSCSSSSSSSTSETERYYEIFCRPKLPEWVDSYLDRVGSVLKQGGWGESDVAEMCSGDKSAGNVSDVAEVEDDDVEMFIDRQAGLDMLLLKADRLSGQLRRAGWSSADVSDALGFDTRPQKARPPPKKLSPEMVKRISRLVEKVSPSQFPSQKF